MLEFSVPLLGKPCRTNNPEYRRVDYSAHNDRSTDARNFTASHPNQRNSIALQTGLLLRKFETMRSIDQREFVPLFQTQRERESHLNATEPADELPQSILRLAKSIESLNRTLSRSLPAQAALAPHMGTLSLPAIVTDHFVDEVGR